jgi:tripartite-type tricarboxylate transporter receptor subunit TctC
LPTIAEAGVTGYETTAWGGIVAPFGTPRELITPLNSEINKVLGTRAISERYAQIGFELTIAPPERLFERALSERPMWAQVVKRSGARVD